MATKTPQEMSNEELLKNEMTYKTSVTITAISCISILAIGIYLMIAQQKINVFLFLPIVFAGTGVTSYVALKGIKAEKATRNL